MSPADHAVLTIKGSFFNLEAMHLMIQEGEEESPTMAFHTPEFSFFVCLGCEETFLIGWSGSWPFPTEHELGCWESIDEAMRYATFLINRENREQEKDNKMWEEMERDVQGTRDV